MHIPKPTEATLVLVGSPNTGKSTIFNVLTRSRAALVADYAGVTRDPLVGQLQLDTFTCTLVDTGGFVLQPDELGRLVNDRILAMIDEASLVLVVVEKAGQPTEDLFQLVRHIRRARKPLLLVLNKSDQGREADVTAWYRLHPNLLETSAVHRRGIDVLCATMQQELDSQQLDSQQLDSQQLEAAVASSTAPADSGQDPAQPNEYQDSPQGPQLVIAGRPNVGKSTLVNRLLGDTLVITRDQPGITRDVLSFPCNHKGAPFVLLDTPGVRRWARLDSALEKFSVLKSAEALRRCDVAVLLIDGYSGLVEQDLRLLSNFAQTAPALVIGVNKIDALGADTKRDLANQLSRHTAALGEFPLVHISALGGKGTNTLITRALAAAQAANRHIATSVLMRTLEQAVAAHPPPTSGRFRPKLKFLHQHSGKRRLTLRLSGNQVTKLAPSYQSYLRNTLTKRFNLQGVCFDLLLQDSTNPYTR